MSNVTLEICGRRYTIACAEGEEGHIEMLGASIDAKLTDMPNMASQSEPRTLLFAALLLADELHEMQNRAKTAQNGAESSADVAEPLENMADRLESLASQLEAAGQSS